MDKQGSHREDPFLQQAIYLLDFGCSYKMLTQRDSPRWTQNTVEQSLWEEMGWCCLWASETRSLYMKSLFPGCTDSDSRARGFWATVNISKTCTTGAHGCLAAPHVGLTLQMTLSEKWHGFSSPWCQPSRAREQELRVTLALGGARPETEPASVNSLGFFSCGDCAHLEENSFILVAC